MPHQGDLEDLLDQISATNDFRTETMVFVMSRLAAHDSAVVWENQYFTCFADLLIGSDGLCKLAKSGPVKLTKYASAALCNTSIAMDMVLDGIKVRPYESENETL
jgi:hypothetical protein